MNAFFYLRFIYLFIHEKHTEREKQRHRQREEQAPHREPDVGLDPGSLGSHPGLKADAKPLSHPGCLRFSFSFKRKCIWMGEQIISGKSFQLVEELRFCLKNGEGVTQ